jgi:hypothetical protein
VVRPRLRAPDRGASRARAWPSTAFPPSGTDAGARDAGTRDAGARDAGSRDAGPPDAGDVPLDAGPPPGSLGGPWSGTWSGFGMGTWSMDMMHTGTDVSGTLVMRGAACISGTAALVGTYDAETGALEQTVTSGMTRMRLTSTVAGSSLAGDWLMETGLCSGRRGTFTGSRD